MGLYDTYGNVQIKTGLLGNEMRDFKIGDKVSLSDGVYVGYESVIVILNSIFIAEFFYLLDKYGGIIETKAMIDSVNPIAQAIKSYEKGGKSTRRRNRIRKEKEG